MKNQDGSMSKLSPKNKSLIAFLVLAAMFPLFALLDRIVPGMGYPQRGAIVANGARIFSRRPYSMPPLRQQSGRPGLGREPSTAGAALDGERKMFQMRRTTRLVAPERSFATTRNGSILAIE
jgi:hypothetical protein